MANTDGQPPRIWFGTADGHMYVRGQPTLSQYLAELDRKVARFLRHVETAPRAPDGAYRLTGNPLSGDGRLRDALGLLWTEVLQLLGAAMPLALSGRSVLTRERGGPPLRWRNGAIACHVYPERCEVPLASLLERLLLSIRHVKDEFPPTLSAETIKMIRSVSDALRHETRHRTGEGIEVVGVDELSDPMADARAALARVVSMGTLLWREWTKVDEVRASDGPPKPIDFPSGAHERQRRAEVDLQAHREAMIARGDDPDEEWVSLDEGRWPEAIVNLSRAFGLFHSAVDVALGVVPSVAPVMDAGEPRPHERWTVRVRAELLEFKGERMGPLSLGGDGLGIVRAGNPWPPRMGELLNAIVDRCNQLSAVARQPEVAAGGSVNGEAAEVSGVALDGVPEGEAEGPTISDLAERACISNETANRIREAAGIPGPVRPSQAKTRRYSPSLVDKMIAAALAGSFQKRREIAAAWSCWGSGSAKTS